MSDKKAKKPAKKVMAMAIETNAMDIAGQGLPPQGRNSSQPGNGDAWLAALERASFALQDDTLRAPEAGPGAVPDPLRQPLLEPPLPAGDRRSSTAPPGAASVPASAAQLAASAARQAHGGQAASPANAAVTAPASGGQRSSQVPLANAFTRLAADKPEASQRYQALLQQARFMDVNLQLTHGDKGPVLWIRDFKQHYAQDLYNWVSDLQAMLAEQGQQVSRIMLNGRPLSHISDLLGR